MAEIYVEAMVKCSFVISDDNLSKEEMEEKFENGDYEEECNDGFENEFYYGNTDIDYDLVAVHA
jgi:hypothetical protein